MVKSALSTQVKERSEHIPVFTVYITSASTTVSVLRGEPVSECWYRVQKKGASVPFYARAAASQYEYEGQCGYEVAHHREAIRDRDDPLHEERRDSISAIPVTG